jgi:phosphatidylserine/phosphatidylglycerophosphate/cardiolipin synthase-like enzyme
MTPAMSRADHDHASLRALADQAFSRAAGASLVGGNRVRVLRDAAENYPAWEHALERAKRTIHVEMYIIHRDAVGRRFVALLADRARAGINVRLIYDWFGCGFGPLLGLFSPLLAAGGEVRVFNPPQLSAALGWTRRDHRKLITVDGRIGYLGGLCVGQAWEGRPDKGVDPWRDTGIEVMGPAVAHLERSFASMWELAGGDASGIPHETTPPAGHVHLRVIPTEPFTAALLRTDLLVTTLARQTLWIADAYFIGHGPFVLALQRAAQDGVDVRLLLPQGSDVKWTVPLSRSLYRVLLDAGVRIFEWNGSMMHAKTAVADGRWSRIGSTNLNLNSWVGNWELDAAIEDEGIARLMEDHYEQDLERATEIVASGAHRSLRPRIAHGRARRSARQALRAITGLGHSLSAAVMGSRQLEQWELAPLFTVGLLTSAIAVLAFFFPRALALPIAVLAAWAGLTLIVESFGLWRERKRP